METEAYHDVLALHFRLLLRELVEVRTKAARTKMAERRIQETAIRWQPDKHKLKWLLEGPGAPRIFSFLCWTTCRIVDCNPLLLIAETHRSHTMGSGWWHRSHG